MSQIQLSFLPPEYWQDFQKIVLADAQREWSGGICEAYRREGQAQDGIDILVTTWSGVRIGIQAKQRRRYEANGKLRPSGGLTPAQIDEIVATAEKFQPPLEQLVIATTALPDKKLQDHVLKINTARSATKKFRVMIRFWDHYQGVLNWNSDLQAIYYGDVVSRTSGYDAERHYMMLIRTAFNRPAFTTRLEVEDSGDDMIRALADTREAIVTGTLNDRQGRRVGRAPIGLDQASAKVSAHLSKAVGFLDAARHNYRLGLKEDTLRSDARGVSHRSQSGMDAAREVDADRSRALTEVNAALHAAGLEQLENMLASK